MKKICIIALLFSCYVIPQTIIDEAFDSFSLSVDANTQALWQFYKSSSNVTLDLTANNNNLTDNDVIKSYTYASPFNNGDSVVFFSLGDYYSIATGSMTGINPGFNSFTWDFWLASPDSNSTEMLLYTGFSVGEYQIYIVANDLIGVKFNNAYPGIPALTHVRTNTWHYIKISFDQSSGRGHVVIDGLKASNDIVSGNMTGNLTIGKNSPTGNNFKGSIAQLRYRNVADSSLSIPTLATGWISKNGNTNRNTNNYEWYQTFSDTIGIPIPENYNLGNLSATLQAKSSATNKTMSVWLGKSQTPKTNVLSVTLSETWASYQFDFGTAALTTADTLWMASANLSNQISADDVVLIRSDIGFEMATFPDNQQFFGFPKL